MFDGGTRSFCYCILQEAYIYTCLPFFFVFLQSTNALMRASANHLELKEKRLYDTLNIRCKKEKKSHSILSLSCYKDSICFTSSNGFLLFLTF
jgi:uncharacterized protein with ParB-like and HNH nuclease domain